ncbi:MAG: hypothetical protein OWR52_10405 [Acidibacillus sp.]|uniref:Cytochrome aa3 subunit 2 n=1 Tax=Sulfoacidibacillus ferrooxidans TaxID=2005001 RepID=A0A9X1V5Z6_9BACL|nr:hypothetical protein [Sulfoacidibacillus ferrooxidans]MCY0893905.1 hypothetical protein [Acidibacillus sp.]
MADLLMYGVLWIVFSVLGELGVSAWGHNFYYYTASTQALDGLNASLFLFRVLTPIFVFVVLMLVYIPIRAIRRPKESILRGKGARFNATYVTIWVSLSLVINLLFFIHPTTSAAEQLFHEMSPKAEQHDLVVDVVARQWEWYFSYPQYGIKNALNANGNNVLYLPVNQPVEFVLRSYDPNHPYALGLDVIHSFWIPAFGEKMDVIPGETRYMVATPTKIASTETNPEVRVQCAEVCGPGHPYMYSTVHIVSASAFKQWVTQQLKAGN